MYMFIYILYIFMYMNVSEKQRNDFDPVRDNSSIYILVDTCIYLLENFFCYLLIQAL